MLVALSSGARAAEPACTEVLSRRNLISCGLNNSPTLSAEFASARASAARPRPLEAAQDSLSPSELEPECAHPEGELTTDLIGAFRK